MVKRIVIFFYGLTSYAIFFATFLYAIGFVGNVGVPKSMDSDANGDWAVSLAIDSGLLFLFALQHSGMARPGFKRFVTRVIPKTIERSTYVLASSLALLFLFWQWRPLGGVVWDLANGPTSSILYCGFAFGWFLVLFTTFVINHFDLFGLRQVWRELQGKPQKQLRFVTPYIYRIVRHPLYVGFLFAFWSTPTMTLTHLVFAAATTAYILIAIQLEERDLVREHPEYVEYRKQVPMLVPGLHRQTTISLGGAAEEN